MIGRRSDRITAVFALLLTMLLAACVSADPPPVWTITKTDNTVETLPDGLHIRPETATAGEASAVSPLALPPSLPWLVTFQVRFAVPIPGSVGVSLMHGTDKVAWMGADGFYKAESGFAGQDMPYTKPVDGDWHTFEYARSGDTLTLRVDGQEYGTSTLTAVPDAIRLTCRQSEVWIRDVAVEVMPASPLPHVKAVKPVFAADFLDPARSAAGWDQTPNGGGVAFRRGYLALHGNGAGYPVLTTHRNPFPASGDWSASFGYRYTSTGGYGTEIRIEREDGDALATVHQDVNGQFIALDGLIVWKTLPDTGWHVLSVSQSHGQVSAFVDGSPAGAVATDDRPARVKIEGGVMSAPWSWNDLEVQALTVWPGVRVADRTALALNVDAPAVPTPPAAVPLSHVHRDFAVKDATIAALRRELAASTTQRRRLADANEDLAARLYSAPPPGVQININATVNIAPSPTPQGGARIANTSLLFSNDGMGEEFCAGQVLIYNDGAYTIDSLSLSLRVNGVSYVLMPYQGSLLEPVPMVAFDIPPGFYLSVPVMTTGNYPSYGISGAHIVEMEAGLLGPPYVAEDEAVISG